MARDTADLDAGRERSREECCGSRDEPVEDQRDPGTGAALAMSLVDAAIAIRDGMATFDSAGVAGPAGPVAVVDTRDRVP